MSHVITCSRCAQIIRVEELGPLVQLRVHHRLSHPGRPVLASLAPSDEPTGPIWPTCRCCGANSPGNRGGESPHGWCLSCYTNCPDGTCSKASRLKAGSR